MSFVEALKRQDNCDWMCHRLTLANGDSFSIQASRMHYCTPREDLDITQYTEFEVGYPSFVDYRLLPFAENPNNPTDTVYGYVPKQILQEIIDDAGGVVE